MAGEGIFRDVGCVIYIHIYIYVSVYMYVCAKPEKAGPAGLWTLRSDRRKRRQRGHQQVEMLQLGSTDYCMQAPTYIYIYGQQHNYKSIAAFPTQATWSEFGCLGLGMLGWFFHSFNPLEHTTGRHVSWLCPTPKCRNLGCRKWPRESRFLSPLWP